MLLTSPSFMSSGKENNELHGKEDKIIVSRLSKH